MYKKIVDTIFVVLVGLGVFGLGYLTGKPPVTEQEIIETTDSLKSTMFEVLEATKDK